MQMVHTLSKFAGDYAQKTGGSKPVGETDSESLFPKACD
jgi:hypothetical protein